jgi:hypothetical protein
MPFVPLIALVMMVTTCAAVKLLRLRLRLQEKRDHITIGRLVNHTGLDAETGAVYSIQTASITTPTERLDGMWSTQHLERLARSYWMYMERFSLGLVRVHYDDRGRYVCFLSKHIPLLGFSEPEYEFGETLGVVRWPIDRGLLISRKGRGRGYLEIEVHRRDGVGTDEQPLSRTYVELEVSGFYPTMNSGLAYHVYKHTQSRYHVLLAYGFIRSLARADLPSSKIGRFAEALGSSEDETVPERIPRPGTRDTDEPPQPRPASEAAGRGLAG